MKLSIVDKQGSEKGEISLPMQFSEEIRQDIILRAVLAIQSRKMQPYGTMKDAGKRQSVRISKRRRNYRGSYGYGISRSPRKILSRRGTRMQWAGGFAPNTVGGRRSHPPKAEKLWAQKINDKERRKAIRSALSAVMNKEIVKARGHIISDKYPFILSNDFENMTRTKEVVEALQKLGFIAELERCSVKKIRAGKGKARGRPYKKKKGILFVVSRKDCGLLKSVKNIPGADSEVIDSINAEQLAPGGVPGRVSLFTEDAIKMLEEKNLFNSSKRKGKKTSTQISKINSTKNNKGVGKV